MLIDLLHPSGRGDRECDVLVIGAGAVGLVLGAYLARNGVDVIVAESGGTKFEERTQALNQAIVKGRHHVGIHDGRARILGGTTTLWGGQLTEFRPIDFEKRDWVEGSDWPLTHQDVFPFYSKVAHFLGLDNYPYDAGEIWAEVKASPPKFDRDLEIFFTRWLRETNLSRIFDADIKKHTNLKILLHASVVELAATGARVTAAKVRAPDGVTALIRANEVVVACGTFEAIRLLLASAADKTTPWRDNRWVGRCFQDHLDLRAAVISILDKQAFSNAFDNIYLTKHKYQPKIRFTDEAQRRERSINIAASIIFESSLSEHVGNLKLFMRALARGAVPEKISELPSNLHALIKLWFPLVKRYLQENRAFNLSDRGTFLNLHVEQLPSNESLVRLSALERDANGVPKIELEWRISGDELITMKRFCLSLDKSLKREGVASLAIDQRLLDLDPSLLEACRDTNHQCGGLRIGTSVSDGVVDRNLKVFDTENLYVAGASTFRTSSFANPTFTAMALAMRLADQLLLSRRI
jgi:choline dehydrogenase-like flavoprotein